MSEGTPTTTQRDKYPIHRTRRRAFSCAVAGAFALAGCSGSADASDAADAQAAPASFAEVEAAEGDARAEALVDRWIESVGGMEAFHEFQSARYSLSTELYDTSTGRMQRERPRYVTLAKLADEQLSRIERWNWTGQQYIVQAFDGDTAWAYVNGQPAPPGQMDADQALYVSRDVFYWFSLPFKLTDPGVNLHYDGTDDQGRHVVRVTFGEGVGTDVWWHLFDENAAWPVETRYQTNGTGSVQRLSFQSIRNADGYFYPEERVHVRETPDGDRVWKILRMSEVEINPEVSMEQFRDPSASLWMAGE